MVSIVIPVYNVAQYVEQCLLSVMDQTYTNLEVLIVDDCGTDNSMAIVEKMVAEYNGSIQIHIFHHDHNRGLSAARNTGIREANGEFVFFLDSDDRISPNCIDSLLKAFNAQEGIEMAMGNVDVDDKEEIWNLLRIPSGIYDNNLFEKYINNDYYIPVWNKLFRRDFIDGNHLYFEDGLVHEDYLWSFQAACHLKKIVVVDSVTYHYLRRDGSLDKNSQINHYLHYSKACMLQAKYLVNFPQLWNSRSIYHYIDYKRYILFIDIFKSGDRVQIEQCYQYLRESPEWSIIRKIANHYSLGNVLLSVHRFLPYRLGMKYYLSFVARH